MIQVGQKIKMNIGNTEIWVQYKQNEGLDYSIYSCPKATFSFSGYCTFAAFIQMMDRIANGTLTEMFAEDKAHYENQ